MNIVIITGLLNYPLKTGGDVVTFNLIEELSHRHQLIVFYPSISDDLDVHKNLMRKLPKVELILSNKFDTPPSIFKRVKDKFKRLIGTSDSAQQMDEVKRVFYRDYSLLLSKLKKKLAKEKVDIIQVEYPWMMGIVDDLPPDIPKVYNAIELTFSMMEEKAETIDNTAEKEAWMEMTKKAKALEIELARKYNAILTISEKDTKVWQQALHEQQFYYSPMGIDTQFFKPRKEVSRFDKVIFIGHGGHHANRDAVKWFFNGIYPLLIECKPEAKIYFTGNYDQAFINQFPKDDNVVWTGFVEDLRDYMEGAISISPVRIGSGIRIKILESMSFGCPVVSTSIGVEGIPCTNEYDVLIADDLKKFADAVIRLLDDNSLALKLNLNSRTIITRHFDKDAVVTKREESLLMVLKDTKRSMD